MLSYGVFLALLTGALATISREACCLKKGVSAKCARHLCDASRPPVDLERYSLFEPKHNCSFYLNEIAICLTEGRDNTQCCEQNASDSDESACFGLCSGSVSPSIQFDSLQSCFALNVPGIYDCSLKGYKTLPSQPTNVRLDGSILRWDAPSDNAHLIQQYKIYLTDSSGSRTTELIRETQSTRFDLSSARIGAKYSAYVVAESAEGRSQASPLYYVGGPPSDMLPEVIASNEAEMVTLGCTITSRYEHGHIDWERKVGHKEWSRLVGQRFKTVSYRAEEEEAPLYVSALVVLFPSERDQARYRCYVRGHPSESREVHLIVSPPLSTPPPPPPSPPETPLECCSRKMTRSQCPSICSGGSDHKRGVKPGAYLPAYRCHEEFLQLMQCTLAQVQNGPCCIRKKVPFSCLGLCDKSIPVDSSNLMLCSSFLDEITTCSVEAAKVRPRAVTGVSLSSSNDSTQVGWKTADGASAYTIYYRRKGAASWNNLQTNRTSVAVRGADEVAILANNAIGSSSPVRKVYEDNEWIDSYE